METQHETHHMELIEKNEIENTPFTLIRKNGGGVFLTMGRYRLTEEMPEKDFWNWYDAKGTMWDIIVKVILLLIDADHRVRDEIAKTADLESSVESSGVSD